MSKTALVVFTIPSALAGFLLTLQYRQTFRANFKTPPFEVCAYLPNLYVRLKF